jgi:enoyl-CoA hydratase/carnithine racemase
VIEIEKTGGTFEEWGLEAQVQRETALTDDFVEGVTAFVEKRATAFQGH